MKALRIFTIVLLVLAALCFLGGLTMSKNAAEKRANKSASNRAEYVDKEYCYNPTATDNTNNCYFI